MRRVVFICALVLGPAFAAHGQTAGEEATDVVSSEPTVPPDDSLKLVLPVGATPLRVDKHLFGIIPNHRAEQLAADYKPLKTWEKFKLAQRDTFDLMNFPLMAGYALQNQISEKGWRGKAVGRNFGQFYGRTFADSLIGNYVTEALMPSLLHEDPRFFRAGVGSLWRRAFLAARQTIVTRNENGKATFNFSEVLGNSVVVATTSLYYPDARRLGPGATRVALAIGNDAMSNMLTEFWPDIKRHIQPLLRRH